MKKNCLIVLLFVGFSINTHAQKFELGIQSSFLISQVEGDRLSGFNKVGYSGGLLGGFGFNSGSKLVVGGFYSKLGSVRGGEQTNIRPENILVELNLSTANVLFAYSGNLGSTWSGNPRFRYLGGFRLNRLLSSSSKSHSSGIEFENVRFDKEYLNNYFISLNLGLGFYLTPDLLFDITYQHSVQNILKDPKLNINKLAPFFLSFDLSYYLFK